MDRVAELETTNFALSEDNALLSNENLGLRKMLAKAGDALDKALASLLHHNHERQEKVHEELRAVYDEIYELFAGIGREES